MRQVTQVLPEGRLAELLALKRPLRVKLGFDPTGGKIHIGRAIQLWKLREFQDLGHQVVMIVGDFTALIGDASDKLQRRPVLTPEQIAANLKQYRQQVGLILDLDKVEWRHNSEWLVALKPGELVRLARQVTVSQMLARHNFKERFTGGSEIGLDELLYPLFQGYDSVAVRADVEIGGTDQLFNLQVGRTLQRLYGQPAQVALVNQMLNGLDGRKMSTSWGNVVNLVDAPQEQFGKLMSMADAEIESYAFLAARMTDEEIAALKKLHPKTAKAQVAGKIVGLYHGPQKAAAAREEFERVFKAGGQPNEMPELKTAPGRYSIIDLLINANLAGSNAEVKRLISEQGIFIDGAAAQTAQQEIELKSNSAIVLQRGKRKFVKIMSENSK